MLKRVCDLCDAEALDMEFVLPYRDRYNAEKSGKVLATFDTGKIKSATVDLCAECAKKIIVAYETICKDSP